MLVSVLASSSKGNSVYVKTQNHELLIDAGTNVKYLNEKLRENGTDLSNIDYILITHTHSDHVSALNNIVKKISSNNHNVSSYVQRPSFFRRLRAYPNII